MSATVFLGPSALLAGLTSSSGLIGMLDSGDFMPKEADVAAVEGVCEELIRAGVLTDVLIAEGKTAKEVYGRLAARQTPQEARADFFRALQSNVRSGHTGLAKRLLSGVAHFNLRNIPDEDFQGAAEKARQAFFGEGAGRFGATAEALRQAGSVLAPPATEVVVEVGRPGALKESQAVNFTNGDGSKLSDAEVSAFLSQNRLTVSIEFRQGLQGYDEALRAALAAESEEDEDPSFDYQRTKHLEPKVRQVRREEHFGWTEIGLEDMGMEGEPEFYFSL